VLKSWTEVLNEGLPENQTMGLERRIYDWDAAGKLTRQRILKPDGQAKSTLFYDQYDAAGNLLAYRVQSFEKNVTTAYTNTLTRLDGYRTQMGGLGPDPAAPLGQVTYSYDTNGYLNQVNDLSIAANTRVLRNDAAGRVLYMDQSGNISRQLVVNGEVLGRYGMAVNPVVPRSPQGTPNFAPVADFNFGYRPISGNYPSPALGRPLPVTPLATDACGTPSPKPTASPATANSKSARRSSSPAAPRPATPPTPSNPTTRALSSATPPPACRSPAAQAAGAGAAAAASAACWS
jgi:hypothetical protein